MTRLPSDVRLVDMPPVPLRRIADRALEHLADTFPLATEVPPLREWPWRALVAVTLCPEGRRLLAHRWRAYSALPGERWRDPRRFVWGVIVDVPRPGAAVVRCATAETLHRFPGALEDGALVLEAPVPWTSTEVGLPIVWRELVDPLGSWWPA